MAIMLASDLHNPEFVGARNPDDLLQAEFNWRETKTMFGKPVLDADGKPKRVLFVRIQRPGDDASVINAPAREDHKKRFPRQWMEFQMREGVPIDGANIPGWMIDEWDEMNEEQKRELKYMRFMTVEQIAYASDMQIQRMGMGGMGLRERAKAALRNRLDATVKEKIAERDKTIAELVERDRKRDAQFEALQAQLAQLIGQRNEPAAQPEAPAQQPAENAKRRGRPPKNKDAVS